MSIYIDRKGINQIIQIYESKNTKVADLKELKTIDSISSLDDINIKRHLLEVKFGTSFFHDNKITYTNLKFFGCFFEFCEFSNCIFKECEFIGCTFRDCDFVKVECIKCIFSSISPDFKLTDSMSKKNVLKSYSECCFVKCKLTNTEFQNSFCLLAIFICNTFHSVKMVNSVMNKQIWYRCDIEKSTIINSSFCDTKFIEIKRFDLDINGDNKSVFDRGTVFDFEKIKSIKEISFSATRHLNSSTIYVRNDFRKRFVTLTQVSRVFKEIGYTDLAWEYYYIGKKNEKNSLRGVSWVTSSLTDALCGYGERPSHTFFCIVFNILLFGFFYLLSGFAIDDRLIRLAEVQDPLTHIIEILKLYCHSVFFSVTTFSTVGYGNYVPVGAISSTMAAIQMLMGIFLTATWTGCIIRKIAR